MDYKDSYLKLRDILSRSWNNNLIDDFFIQLQMSRQLNKEMITAQLENYPMDNPPWLSLVNKTDIRNIVVFLMWQEFSTVIHAGDYNEESSLGIHIEDLGVYLETKYYMQHIENLQYQKFEENPISYFEHVKDMVETHGLDYAISQIKPQPVG